MLMKEGSDKEVLESKEIQENITENVITENNKITSKAQIDEEKVIEKIKNFIAKIAAMQEEAAREESKSAKESKSKEERKTVEEKETLKEKKEKIDNSNNKVKYMLEYYDLPYRYNETVVKILAQTPKKLFVYWDISDNDRDKYVETFGEDFFEKTYPVLLLYNENMKYVREIPINDFANSWYIDVQDSKTTYTIQLGRKFKQPISDINVKTLEENSIILKTDYLPFANSNSLEVPNDHVLLEYLPRFLTFRNVKTNEETVKDLRSFKDTFGKNYKVKDFYTNQYKDELSEGIFDMANPSSKISSSTFK